MGCTDNSPASTLMPASSPMNVKTSERARQTRLVQNAVARGQAALAAGARIEASRWLDRARRLAPGNDTITLLLASAAIGVDNERATSLFTEVLAAADVCDAWLGLATARFLAGDLSGARSALHQVLGRHALRADVATLADQVARATGAPGWCGLTSDGVVIAQPVGQREIDVRIDGRPSFSRDDPARPGHEFLLPSTWRRSRRVTVVSGKQHLIGSPLSPGRIGRIDGFVEAWENGIRGWAWCPADPDTDPTLTIGTSRARKEIIATEPTSSVPGLGPLARPRLFSVPWADLRGHNATIHVRGRDGRDLPGSPLARLPRDEIATPKARTGSRPDARPQRRRPAAGQERWRTDAREAAILVTHDDGGGVERRIEAAIAFHQARGRRAVVLRPGKLPNGGTEVRVDSPSFPNLRFELPREQPALLRLLRGVKPVEVELHHFLNHDPSVFQVIRDLGVPYDAHTHDYAWFCPRIALVGRHDRYCGEPEQAACEACVADLGSYLHEDITVPALRDRSREFLCGARRVIAPSQDAADRMARHFPRLPVTVIPHEDDDAVAEPPPILRVDGPVRICVAGAIGLHKGFHVLLDCALDASKRGLDLTFVVAGTTIDDQRLMDTGRVFVTGPYKPSEAVALIRAQRAALALLPSIWPETWCLGLTELWRAGLLVAAFDIGAPAERIRRTGRGFLLPLGLPASAINDTLSLLATGRSLLPIRGSSAYKAPG